MSAAAAKRTVLVAASIAAAVALAAVMPAAGAPDPDRQAPSTPTNMHVTSATPSLVTVAWDPSTDNVGVAGYYVWGDQGKVGLGERAKITVDGPQFTVSGLGCGRSVKITVAAFDAAGNRSARASTTVATSACLDTQPPSAPTGFSQAATTQNSVILTWAPSYDNTGVVAYGVYRNLLLAATPSSPSATLSNLSCGTTYPYSVDAVDAAGNHSTRASVYVRTSACSSAGDTSPPSSPTGLSASNVTSSGLSLSWSASSDNVAVTGYDVYRNGSKVATANSTSATQSGLSCGTTYAFGVVARDAAGNASAQAQLSTATTACASQPPTTDTSPPSSPTGLSASNVTFSGLSLSWSASSDNVAVTGYDVYRNGSKVATVNSTSATQSGLSCGTTYAFGVVARDAAGNASGQAQLSTATSACAEPSTTTDTRPPSTPSSVAISSATQTAIGLTWAASSDNVGVAGYRVYVNGAYASTTAQPGTTVSGLACGTAYTLAVDAFDAEGNASSRASVTGSTSPCADTQAPSVPSSITAMSRTTTSIALSWSASTDNVGVAGYGLYQGGVQQGTTTSTTAIFSGLVCNTNYTLAVDAYDAAGNRSTKGTVMVATTACPDTTPPSPPTGLVASNVTQSGATLGWNASTDNVGVSGYDVYRGGTKVATLASTSFVQTGLACGTSYLFGVVARDAAGNSSTQASLQVSTAACSTPPPATSGTLLFDGGFDTGNLGQWDSSWKGTNGIVPVTSDAGVSPRGGPYMARFAVSPNDTPPWGYSDTDMVYRYNTIAGHYDVLGDDKYYGFSLYFPSGAAYQPKPGAFNYLFELHGNTDGQAPVKVGIDTNGTNPDSIKLELHVDDVSPAGAWNPALITDLGPVVFDRWIDFVVHVRWKDDSTGVLQTWVDGTKKVDQTRKTWGGNGVMTTVKPAFGMYRDDYTATWTFYGDSYKIGTSYSAVSP